MEFKNIKNVSEDGVATMLLYSHLGEEGIDGQYFAEEMRWLQDNCTQINLRINSEGGSIVDGYSIVSTMLTSKVPVCIYIDGLAASMAGIIAMCGTKTYMSDFGLFMMHNPSGGDPQILQYFKDTLVTILTKRTGMNPEECSAMMDKETWMNAKECLKMGLIDEIINTKKKVNLAPEVRNDVRELRSIFNRLINKTQNRMEKIINKLSLAEDATEEVILNSIAELQGQRDRLMEDLENAAKEKTEMEEKLAKLESEIENFNKEKKDAEEAAKLAEKKRIEDMVDGFVKAAKIKSEEKQKYINLATVDFETTKEMLERAGVKNSINIADLISPTGFPMAHAGREDWTHRDWEKKDPNGLAKMKRETPEIYNALFDSTYRKKN